MHGGEEQIVPAIAEMRDAAFGFAEIAYRGGDVDGRDAAPDEAHRGLGVKIETAHPGGAFHDGQQAGDGVDAEPEQRIADGARRFDSGEAVGQATADDA